MNKRLLVLAVIALAMVGGTWAAFTLWERSLLPDQDEVELREAIYRLQIACESKIKPASLTKKPLAPRI